MNDKTTIFHITFTKNRDAVEYAWEQPNVPWMTIEDKEKNVHTHKCLCDFSKKRVYVKISDNFGYSRIKSLENYLCDFFNFDEEAFLGRYDDAIWTLIDDLKRNLHNGQSQVIKFEISRNSFGFSKVNGNKKWMIVKL